MPVKKKSADNDEKKKVRQTKKKKLTEMTDDEAVLALVDEIEHHNADENRDTDDEPKRKNTKEDDEGDEEEEDDKKHAHNATKMPQREDDEQEKLDSLDDFMNSSKKHSKSSRVSDSSESKSSELPEIPYRRPDVSLRLYRRIALGFVIATGGLLVFMLIFSATSATVTINPKKETIAVSLLRTIGGTTDRVDGAVFVEDVVLSQGFSVEKGKEIEGRSTGKIKVINNSKESVSLIPRTRFQSKDGIIFRAVDRVNVAAGKNVIASVVADVAGKTGNVSAGQFTIPGLSAEQQKEIVGESLDAMSGGVRVAGILTDTDIAKAKVEMVAKLKQDKVTQYKVDSQAKNFGSNVVSADVLQEKVEGKIGSEVDRFTIEMKMRVSVVFFDMGTFDTLTRQAVFAKVPDGRALHTVSDPQYTVEKVDAQAKTATIKLMREGIVVLDSTSQLISTDKFVNMLVPQIEKYLMSTNAVDTFEVHIRPRWRTKTPSAPEKIKVIVNVE